MSFGNFNREVAVDTGRSRAVCEACGWKGSWQGQETSPSDLSARATQVLAALPRLAGDFAEHACVEK